jgi:hypothetical protein
VNKETKKININNKYNKRFKKYKFLDVKMEYSFKKVGISEEK